MAANDIYSRTISHYLAPIAAYLRDTRVTESMVNRADEIYIERDGKLERVTAKFADDEVYQAAVNNILQFTGKTLSDDHATRRAGTARRHDRQRQRSSH